MPHARSSPAGPTKSSNSRKRTFETSGASEVVIHGAALGVACFVSYELTAHLLRGVHSVAPSDDLLGAMWAVLATVFVYRGRQTETSAAAISRLAATAVSLALCLIYLLIAPPHPWAMAMLVALGTILVTLAGRPGDSITTGITIAVVMVVAQLEPRNAWEQPILRLADTVVGVIVGVVATWLVRRAPRVGTRARARRLAHGCSLNTPR
jgi:putative flippase GtrA